MLWVFLFPKNPCSPFLPRVVLFDQREELSTMSALFPGVVHNLDGSEHNVNIGLPAV
jgi:hypothetical protein